MKVADRFAPFSNAYRDNEFTAQPCPSWEFLQCMLRRIVQASRNVVTHRYLLPTYMTHNIFSKAIGQNLRAFCHLPIRASMRGLTAAVDFAWCVYHSALTGRWSSDRFDRALLPTGRDVSPHSRGSSHPWCGGARALTFRSHVLVLWYTFCFGCFHKSSYTKHIFYVL